MIVQQLLLLDDDKLAIPITNGISLQSAIGHLSTADAHTYTLRDDNASNPSTVTEAKCSKYWSEWLAAMHDELASLRAKGVYEEVDIIPFNRKPVQCKWVLHIKRDKTGAISRFKARLVARGFTQIPGQDFSFTFALVARWDSIRSLLCLAAIHDFKLRQLDVKTAYLNGPLDEEIYMKAPEGFSYTSPFWRLRKGLYVVVACAVSEHRSRAPVESCGVVYCTPQALSLFLESCGSSVTLHKLCHCFLSHGTLCCVSHCVCVVSSLSIVLLCI